MKKDDGKKRRSIPQKVMYFFDLWLSKGTLPTIVFLFLVTGLFILIVSALVVALGGKDISMGKSLWDTMNHAIDSGVLAGDSGGFVYILLMFVTTLFGVFFLAMLIGLINDGIQERVADLSKGIEPVVEDNHVIILGFNESAIIILGELIEAYDNQKGTRNAVVIMDQMPKAEMEDRIRIEYPDTGNLTVVCRSGSITNSKDLHRCSILTCKSIIIASHDDFETIKGILACTKILDETENSKAYITSVIYGRENEMAARIAGNDQDDGLNLFSVKTDRLELMMMDNTASKIITHTCRQDGLSKIFAELFSYRGQEFYVARPELNKNLYAAVAGKSIRQINRCLPDVVAIGIIQKDGSVLIDDPDKVMLGDGCQLILLQEDDDEVVVEPERSVEYQPPVDLYQPDPSSILIFGCNEKLPYILREMCEYLMPGTLVYLAANPDELDEWLTDDIIEEMVEKNIDSAVRIERKDPEQGKGAKLKNQNLKIDDYKNVFNLLSDCNPRFVLILVPDDLDDEQADEQALKLLLYFKKYKELNPEVEFSVTCEMRSIENQQLAQDSMASDFVISRNIASLMMAQIAENRELMGIFESILCSEGYEIYMKPARYYFTPDPQRPIDFYSIQEAAADKGEIFIGYKKTSPEGNTICINPRKVRDGKPVEMIFDKTDELVVLAENMEVRA